MPRKGQRTSKVWRSEASMQQRNDWHKRKYWGDPAYRERQNAACVRNYHRLRAQFLRAYGPVCACCGETTPEFLTIEHTRRDGKEHRERLGASNGVLLDLRKRGWPKDEGIAVFCYNCNLATKSGRTCPHKGGRWIFPESVQD